jgi:hypothetical protein
MGKRKGPGRGEPKWFQNIPRLKKRTYCTQELEILLGASSRTIAARFKSRGVYGRTGNDRLRTYWSGEKILDLLNSASYQPALF